MFFLLILSSALQITLHPPGGLPLPSLWVCPVWAQQEESEGRALIPGQLPLCRGFPPTPPALSPPGPGLLLLQPYPEDLFLALRLGQHDSKSLHQSSGGQRETCFLEDPHWYSAEEET